VDRVLDVLAEADVRSTWFVPGFIADREPETIDKIVAAGHEVESRAWGPEALSGQPLDAQREEIRRGIEAVQQVTGVAPSGFRAPTGEVDENTFRALQQLGVSWSSILRGGEIPTPVVVDDSVTVLDVGYRWELTDYVHFQFNYGPIYPAGAPRIASYASVEREWIDDALATTNAGVPCVFTLTPDVIGKPGRATVLRHLLAELKSNNIDVCTIGEIARSSTAAL
jgi:peptidoglycan/xylan/chitin deacetylase (PgdA/CDA1 family)